jgi:hypothetical protein
MKNIYRLFLIPLFVGLIIAIIQFGLPYFFKEKKELTYKIIEPISYFDPSKVSELEIIINGAQSKSLVSNQFNIENSGQIPLKDIRFRINFLAQDTLFKIYSYSYETQPKFEFGPIKPKLLNGNLQLTFDLLNPGDKIFINVLTNSKVNTEVYSKSEGMILNRATDDKDSSKDKERLSFILAILGSILSTLLAFLTITKSVTSIKEIKTLMDRLFNAKQHRGLRIISALYGKNEKYYDVTEKLTQLVAKDKLNVIVNNEIAGDPIHGIKKELKVVYSIGQDIETIIVDESETLVIPADDKNAT